MEFNKGTAELGGGEGLSYSNVLFQVRRRIKKEERRVFLGGRGGEQALFCITLSF